MNNTAHAQDLVIENWPDGGASSNRAVLWCQDNLRKKQWRLVSAGKDRTWLRIYDQQDLAQLILSVDLVDYCIKQILSY